MIISLCNSSAISCISKCLRLFTFYTAWNCWIFTVCSAEAMFLQSVPWILSKHATAVSFYELRNILFNKNLSKPVQFRYRHFVCIQKKQNVGRQINEADTFSCGRKEENKRYQLSCIIISWIFCDRFVAFNLSQHISRKNKVDCARSRCFTHVAEEDHNHSSGVGDG